MRPTCVAVPDDETERVCTGKDPPAPIGSESGMTYGVRTDEGPLRDPRLKATAAKLRASVTEGNHYVRWGGVPQLSSARAPPRIFVFAKSLAMSYL